MEQKATALNKVFSLSEVKDEALLKIIPEDLCERLQTFAVGAVDNKTLRVASVKTLSSSDLYTIEVTVNKLLKRNDVKIARDVFSITETDFLRTFERIHGSKSGTLATVSGAPAGITEKQGQAGAPADADTLHGALVIEKLKTAASAAEQRLGAIIEKAFERKASDIHIDFKDATASVRVRVDGRLEVIAEISHEMANSMVSAICAQGSGGLVLTKAKLIPLDGQINAIYAGKTYDFRVATCPCGTGNKHAAMVIRILDKQGNWDLDKLGFSPENRERIDHALSQTMGVVLVTGPTGSGKSTTLYAMLKKLNQDDRKIITIENPIEYTIEGAQQVQVNERQGLTFVRGLRSFLRMDPNVMMVGETRDAETAETVANAADTGHLVLSTLHTNSVVATIGRLHLIGAPKEIFESLVCVMAQRLVRKINPQCWTTEEISAWDVKRQFGMDVPDDRRYKVPVRIRDLPESERRRRGITLPPEDARDYAGRVAIHEVLVLNSELQQMIVEGAPRDDIQHYAVTRLGMKTLRQDAFEKVQQGLVSMESVIEEIGKGETALFDFTDDQQVEATGVDGVASQRNASEDSLSGAQ